MWRMLSKSEVLPQQVHAKLGTRLSRVPWYLIIARAHVLSEQAPHHSKCYPVAGIFSLLPSQVEILNLKIANFPPRFSHLGPSCKIDCRCGNKMMGRAIGMEQFLEKLQ